MNEQSGTITVVLNGEHREIPEGLTVSELLAHLDLDERMIVVEHNREIRRRAEYGDIRVKPDDEIELVHFVGGG